MVRNHTGDWWPAFWLDWKLRGIKKALFEAARQKFEIFFLSATGERLQKISAKGF